LGLETAGQDSAAPNELSVVSRKLLNTLRPDVPIQLDALLETFDELTSSETIAALFELEMTGLARQLPGKNFVRVW
jgi:DNA processing protein